MFFVATADQLSHATPARWDRALERARTSDLHVRRADRLGTFKVSSASHPGHWHETDGTFCTCDAAAHGDPVCCHRAAVRSALAKLAAAPTPERVAAQIAQDEREYLYRTLDTCNAALARDGQLSERQYRGFVRAQERLADLGDSAKVAA